MLVFPEQMVIRLLKPVKWEDVSAPKVVMFLMLAMNHFIHLGSNYL